MKNKFYFTTKIRTSFYALTLLFCGIFVSCLQAQTTHVWKPGNIGTWNDLNNWNSGPQITQTATASTATQLTITSNNGVLAGDVITGGNITGTVTVLSLSGGNRVNFAATTIPTTGVPYTITKPSSPTAVPGVGSNVQITDGICTLDSDVSVKSVTVSNSITTSAQGKLIIDINRTLTVSNSGGPLVGQETILLNGGLIENKGIIASNATAANGAGIRFAQPNSPIAADWGIIGGGTFALSNTVAVAPTQGAIQSSSTLGSSAPIITINSGSTFNTTTTPSPTYAYITLFTASSNIRIKGAGFTAPADVQILKFAADSTLNVDPGVTLTWFTGASSGTWPSTATINNAGTLATNGVTSSAIINNIGNGIITGLTTLGVNKNELDTKIKLWPNPAKGQLNITNDLSQNDGDSSIEICNVNGQVVHSQKSNAGTSTSIQTSNWAKGAYILKLSNNNTKTTKKLIVE